MAESKRTKQRIADRQGFAQTWDDAQVQHREANAEPWEGDRVFHIPPNYVVKRVTAQRKPPEVRICRLRNQSCVGTLPPSTSTLHCPAC
jgi:hypothetical protein